MPEDIKETMPRVIWMCETPYGTHGPFSIRLSPDNFVEVEGPCGEVEFNTKASDFCAFVDRLVKFRDKYVVEASKKTARKKATKKASKKKAIRKKATRRRSTTVPIERW